MNIKKVLIVGSGTLGQQIGFQCAMHGFDDHDVRPARGIARCVPGNPPRVCRLFANHAARARPRSMRRSRAFPTPPTLRKPGATPTSSANRCRKTLKSSGRSIRCCTSTAPPKTIFTTNTSTLLPSQFADATGRPARFCALHFANEIWDRNVGEVMGHPGTDREIYEIVVKFAKAIGMVPIRLGEGTERLRLNSLLVPWLMAAQSLVTNGVAQAGRRRPHLDDHDQDAVGPFGILDMVGLETAYNVASYWGEVNGDEQLKKNAAYFKKHFVDQNKLGVKTGEGYYKHPNPAYAAAGLS